MFKFASVKGSWGDDFRVRDFWIIDNLLLRIIETRVKQSRKKSTVDDLLLGIGTAALGFQS